MADNCPYTMKVYGKKENIEEFVRLLCWEAEFEENGLGKTYSVLPVESEMINEEVFMMIISGDCAWSVNSAMMDRKISLESETRRLGLFLEVFSEEYGYQFQEHLLINKGDVILNECVGAACKLLEEIDDSEFHALCKKYNLSPKEAEERAAMNDGYCSFGGFGDDYESFLDYAEWIEIAEHGISEYLIRRMVK